MNIICGDTLAVVYAFLHLAAWITAGVLSYITCFDQITPNNTAFAISVASVATITYGFLTLVAMCIFHIRKVDKSSGCDLKKHPHMLMSTIVGSCQASIAFDALLYMSADFGNSGDTRNKFAIFAVVGIALKTSIAFTIYSNADWMSRIYQTDMKTTGSQAPSVPP